MSQRTIVVDHGIGNLLNVVRALSACGADARLSCDPKEVAGADRLILPGVGAFRDCMAELDRLGLSDAVRDFHSSERPLLGICVGMQILFELGEEYGETPGLGLLPGRVVAVPETGNDGTRHRIPHIGWAALEPAPSASWDAGILGGLPSGSAVYFLHSFMAVPADPAHRLAECDYDGRRICAAVGRGTLFGCQFHPEKSGPAGLTILKRFLTL
ncbi:imidazole glycerol phosphate synthase subunit HisH [Azospirillum sp. B21]|uniref:imidazole glycerol phosphate synthase subunit HisH n=1 Tax=Azospirillum sp. B21 TaxID=2607496 RepID=UPI0011EEDA38|nr:imidazole glycerol phosphate synthase subunit HisH [Azospirillum sp. B21]KAA0577869.1 imidazole glycerol phosphate synthase subunit HisH [Azospirillum sp. B21]